MQIQSLLIIYKLFFMFHFPLGLLYKIYVFFQSFM